MKKITFLFAMLASVATSAQSHINIEMLSATYTGSPVVEFRVSWSSIPIVLGEIHNSKIWVWIDFLKLNADNTTAGNTWTRAEISGTPTVNSSPASAASRDVSTNKGFWLNGDTGSYSATVTVTLSNIPANTKFNWCAYVSDCPPNVTVANGTYTFKGTSPFTLIASNGTSTQTVTGKILAASALTITPTTIRDKTECPSVFCIYNGSDLHIDATHICQQRTSGAQNWEAWIKDSRDEELYRIVFMPDNKWWLAQNVKYAETGTANTAAGCTPDKCGRLYSGAQMSSTYTGSIGVGGYGAGKQGICPNNWILPVYVDWRAFVDAIKTVTLSKINSCTFQALKGYDSIITERLASYNNPVRAGNDYYGWANGSFPDAYSLNIEGWRGNDNQFVDWALLLCYIGCENTRPADGFSMELAEGTADRPIPVRCVRQL